MVCVYVYIYMCPYIYIYGGIYTYLLINFIMILMQAGFKAYPRALSSRTCTCRECHPRRQDKGL